MSFLSNLLTIPVVRQNSHISESQIPNFSIFKFGFIKILPPLRFYIYIFPPSKLALLIATQLRIKHTLLVDTMANRRKIMRRKRQSRNRPDRPFKYNGAEIWSNEKKFCRWIEIRHPYDIAVSSGRGDVEKEKKEGKTSYSWEQRKRERTVEKKNRHPIELRDQGRVSLLFELLLPLVQFLSCFLCRSETGDTRSPLS